ncbi:hypothetical protein SCHPADRAFT_898867 [Schizopora paradoxa]|uniref:G-patch domain-containing protein n=1 Tax=Schizopora paradoxa TaxID=27342 RepID=A0A0H2S4Y7_9AGAM|nr:hypothetical protein SCHPADRAFT_898867 [Schizopora paradoxa]
MTSRLKRKLNDIGVDTSSAKVNENFCLIGTPLPPLEKTKDTGEFLPVWKQDVRDEKGRRRLHGAFTGGFSAGYFNTVGSAEGWTPSTFTSSRGERAKAKKAKPEDFMDEEDLAEMRESRKLVDTNDQMDVDIWSSEGRKADATGEDESLTRALESALLPPTRDSVGAQILRKMGWRLGHGIGPRITYEQRKAQDTMYGDTSSSLDDDEEAKKHMYPPRDTRVHNFKRKDDSFGLGYVPSKGLTELVRDSSGDKRDSGPNISAGFGLGALNDADDDDVDFYDVDSNRNQSRRQVAYEGEEDERIVLGQRNKRDTGRQRPLPVHEKSVASVAGFFNDGTPVLSGFIVADKPVQEEKWFPLPKVPKDWIPNPSRVWQADKENLENNEKNLQHGKAKMTSDQRGKALGETPLPAAPRSVFDYLSQKDRDRLKNMSAGNVAIPEQQPVSTADPGPEPAPSDAPTIPRLDPNVAKMALLGFQPYVADPLKHARYTAFLNAQAAGEDAVPFGRLPNQKESEFAKELSDYAKNATIFKPVSTTMSGRFASATVVQLGPTVKEGLYKPEESGFLSNKPEDQSSAGSVSETKKKEETPKENAARLSMFGPLTREVKTWLPAKLLCKRFGVKEPVIEATEGVTPTPGPSFVSKELLAITDEAPANASALNGQTEIGSEKPPTKPGRRDIANIGLGEDETQGKDILTYERPSMDIFKAIFASDDEDSDDDEQEAKDDGRDDKVAESSNEVANNVPEGAIASASVTQVQGEKVAKSNLSVAVVEPVDLSSFKPTFVPRSERSKGKEKERGGEVDRRDKTKKKKDKKGKGKTLMSFDVDDGEEGNKGVADDIDREHKRKKKRKDKIADDDWVEKPIPEVVQNFTAVPAQAKILNEDVHNVDSASPVGPARGRKRAIDFM